MKLIFFIARPIKTRSFFAPTQVRTRIPSDMAIKLFRKDDRKKPNPEYPAVNDFLRLAVIFYNSVGLEPYESSNPEKKPGILFHMYFAFQISNMTLCLVEEIIFVVVSFRNNENFLESCMVLSYIGFVTVGGLKYISVLFRKKKMTNLVRQLESFFPNPKDHEKYSVKEFLKRCHSYTKGFGGLYTILVVIYNFFNLIQYSILHLLQSPNAKKTMPYVNMAPWDYQANWKFYLTYLAQTMGGYTATCGHISADLMIFAVAMQVIMHFNRLARALKEFQVQACSGSKEGADEDLKELRSLISYHNQVLGLIIFLSTYFKSKSTFIIFCN